MKTFDYHRATSVSDASSAAKDGGVIIAGGTNLLDLMKLEVMAPDKVVDITRLKLKEISKTETGGLRVGALVSNSDLAADMRIRRDYPMLARALLSGASGQLRNMATTGGNLLQRTRCYYFYNTDMPCNKREPGSGCSAIDGFNRMHAVLGANENCIAVHPSDMAVAMRALDVQVGIRSAAGDKRVIDLDDLYASSDAKPHIETTLDDGDIITHVILPDPAKGEQIYRKVRDRSSYAFALVSVAALIAVEDDRISHAQLAFGGLAPRPWRDKTVEDILVGQTPSPELFEAAATAFVKDAKTYGHNDFKVPLVKRTLKAVLKSATHSGSSS